jgi:hypothetical protein
VVRRILSAAALGVLVGAAAHANTDVVTMSNGDRLTGEIKSLDRGKLSFETDATNTIQIEWDHVATLTSAQNFEVTLDDGRILFGSLLAGADPSVLSVATPSAPMALPTVTVVRMTPIERRVIERIDMSVDLGYNLAKANDARQTSAGFDFSYRDVRRLISLNADASTSVTENDPSSTRLNTNLSWRGFLEGRRWDPISMAQVERNDELGIARRMTAGGGMSRWIRDTNQSRISFLGGLVYGSEQAAGAEGSKEAAEAVVGFGLERFRYDSPELDLSARLAVYERLTGRSRTRGNLDIDFRWELFSDSFWGFSLYYSFDSNPESEGAAGTDYGITTSFGWDF